MNKCKPCKECGNMPRESGSHTTKKGYVLTCPTRDCGYVTSIYDGNIGDADKAAEEWNQNND